MTTAPRFVRAAVLTTDGDVVRDGMRLLHREARGIAQGQIDPSDSCVVKIFAVMAFTDADGEILEDTVPDMVEVEQRHIHTGQADEQDYIPVRYGLFLPRTEEPVATFSFHLDARG